VKISTDQFLKQPIDKPLANCYWLTGDEPFQLQKCRDQLLHRAKKFEFNERQRLETTSVDRSLLQAELYATSLFSNKRIIEINLNQGKLNETLVELLLKFCQKPNPDVLLVLHSPKLESGVTQNRAYKAFDALGTIIQSWPILFDQLPKWFAEQLAQHQLRTSLSGLKLLAELTEGNLLYAAQSVEKLALAYTPLNLPEDVVPQASTTELTPEQIMAVVGPQVHFDTFQLNEAFLLGEKIRALKICRNLRSSGCEIIMVWGALLKDIHLLFKLSLPSAQKNFADTCQQLGIWEKRRPLYRTALQHIKIDITLLKAMEAIDRLIKNSRAGDPWLALEWLMLKFIR
jgi:DNA polymerase-3 subunit delta